MHRILREASTKAPHTEVRITRLLDQGVGMTQRPPVTSQWHRDLMYDAERREHALFYIAQGLTRTVGASDGSASL